MGCIQSKPPIIEGINGDYRDFNDRFKVDRILGRGEFGTVKLIHRKNDPEEMPLACKHLRKGMHIEYNTLYMPTKPQMLKNEVNILRTLNGDHHNMKLIEVYESRSIIYIITEYCELELLKYVTTCFGSSDIRTEDVSRIAFELFDAIAHCAKNGIIHRDIKPENIMFRSASRDAPLVLVDYGSGTIDDPNERGNGELQQERKSDPVLIEQHDGTSLLQHTTFAGSAFYISPEMFGKKYTCKTDVWSAGVVLYVLVAGYPVDALQKAFNMLQDSKDPSNRKENLKKLPNMPSDMPETFFDLLEMTLTYRHRRRSTADDVLSCDFVQFHKATQRKEKKPQMTLFNLFTKERKPTTTESKPIEEAVHKHKRHMKYEKFERSLTRSMLVEEVKSVLRSIDEKFCREMENSPETEETLTNKERLQVIQVEELRNILHDKKFDVLMKDADRLSEGENYNKFSYNIALLRDFVRLSQHGSKQEEPHQSLFEDERDPKPTLL